MPLLEGRHQIVVPCSPGIAPLLSREIRAQKLPVLEELATSVTTRGDFHAVLKLNLHLRCGQRVLWRLAAFKAEDADQLYAGLMPLPWEELIPADGYFTVTSIVDNPTIRDNRFANLRVKDAIVDRIRKRCGRRPDSGPRRDRLVFYLFWRGDEVRIYLDTSGPTLARRDYRLDPGKAPLRETLAAALVLTSGWEGKGSFLNPMCGSGTLAIEAALLARNIPPGLLRQEYSFQFLKDYKNREWRTLKAEARRRTRPDRRLRIIASDIDPAMIRLARENAERAGVGEVIEFIECDFAATPVPEGGGVVLCNPEYGSRLGAEEELKKTYRRLGDFFKQRAAGYTAWVFSGNPALMAEVGLRPAQRFKFDNGGIPCELASYPLYSGSLPA
ncbi:MAG: class I SAM-dependent RNA methyltransferase [Deltaproteobacteria bacterium]|nr:class I SAM-dependent RNA methyltransferase [Deltaproteobacteria bacterium]